MCGSASYKDSTLWTQCTSHPSAGSAPPRKKSCPPRPSAAAGFEDHLSSSVSFEPHRISRHDHQTGQADTWILSPPPEAGRRRGADTTTRPCRQSDSHDAGHHGTEFVLLQCQTDDGEGQCPACTLKRRDPSDHGDDGRTNEK